LLLFVLQEKIKMMNAARINPLIRGLRFFMVLKYY